MCVSTYMISQNNNFRRKKSKNLRSKFFTNNHMLLLVTRKIVRSVVILLFSLIFTPIQSKSQMYNNIWFSWAKDTVHWVRRCTWRYTNRYFNTVAFIKRMYRIQRDLIHWPKWAQVYRCQYANGQRNKRKIVNKIGISIGFSRSPVG